MATKNVLKSFRDATVLLSGQKYATLGLSYFVIAGLQQYLATVEKDPFENLLKNKLLLKFEYYFGREFISIQQIQASLVSAKNNLFLRKRSIAKKKIRL